MLFLLCHLINRRWIIKRISGTNEAAGEAFPGKFGALKSRNSSQGGAGKLLYFPFKKIKSCAGFLGLVFADPQLLHFLIFFINNWFKKKYFATKNVMYFMKISWILNKNCLKFEFTRDLLSAPELLIFTPIIFLIYHLDTSLKFDKKRFLMNFHY